jgi:delta-aminolevulinic acid dehydratase/porphobilinogen synthase
MPGTIFAAKSSDTAATNAGCHIVAASAAAANGKEIRSHLSRTGYTDRFIISYAACISSRAAATSASPRPKGNGASCGHIQNLALRSIEDA